MKKFKRLASGILAVMLLCCATACGKNAAPTEEPAPTPTTTTTYIHSTVCGGYPTPETWYDVPSTYKDAEEAFTGKTIPDYSKLVKTRRVYDVHVEVLATYDWNELRAKNSKTAPSALYHAKLMWEAVYADKNGDVEFVKVTRDEMTEHMITSTAVGDAPDVIPMDYEFSYPRWSAGGLTEPLELYATHLELGRDFQGEELYHDQYMDYFKWGDESHGAVFATEELNKQYIVYNKTMFADILETDPMQHWMNGAWNWTQFVECAENLTDVENGIYGFAGEGLFPYHAPYPMITIDNDTGYATLNIDNENYKRYMAEVFDFYQHSGAVKLDETAQTQWKNALLGGSVAMAITTKAGFKDIFEEAKRTGGDKFGIAPLPAFDPNGEELSISSVTPRAYGIASAAKNPAGAAALIGLMAMVSHNIALDLYDEDWYEENLTHDELGMLEETANYPVCAQLVSGVRDVRIIVDERIVPAIYYAAYDGSVEDIFESYRSMIQAEIETFNEEVEASAYYR